MLGALTLNAEDCPCEGGTAEYSVDCDGDGTNDACSTDDCEPCEAGNPASTGMECCGDEEFDPTASTSESFSPPSSITDALADGIKNIPFVDDASTSADITAEVFDCCDADTIVSDGKKSLSGTVSASATINKTLSPIDFDFSRNWWGCGEVGVIAEVGPYIEVSPSVSATVSGTLDECGSDNWGASGTATGTLTGGLQSNIVAVVCDESTYVELNASATTGVTGTISWNSNSGTSGTACVHDLTGDVTATAELPLFGRKSFPILDDYVIVSGNC